MHFTEFIDSAWFDFDFGHDEDFKEESEPSKLVPGALKETRSSLTSESEDEFKPHHDKYDNYWTYNKNDKKWTCHLNPENVSIK